MHLKNIPAKWWKYILISIHALLLTYVCYVAGNVAYSLGSEVQTVKWLNTIRSWLFDNKEELPDELLPICVSYDKQLIDVSDQYGMPLGVIDITDRSKLYRLLSAIDSVGNYKYVMCDMTFSAEYETDVDSALYALISRMPRIVVAGGEHTDLLPEPIRHRAFSAGYNISIEESNFVKYPLVSNGRESMALQMWKELYAGEFDGNAFWSSSNGRLCRSAMFLQLPIQISDNYAQYQARSVLNMGADILDVEAMIDMQSMFSDKIILIGSFVEDDIHATVVGDMPGVMINYNAFYALRCGQHYVKPISVILLFVLFYCVTLLLLGSKSIFEWLPAKIRPKSIVVRLMCFMISLSTIFSVVFLFFYIFLDETYDIFFIASYFSLMSAAKDIYKIIKPNSTEK